MIESCPVCEIKTDREYGVTLAPCPVNINVYFDTQQAATAVTKRELHLQLCQSCGFIFNASFDPSLITFDEDFCSAQSASPRFVEDRKALVRTILEEAPSLGLILEVGCGNGYFLNELTTAAKCEGIGFDPSYSPQGTTPSQLQIHQSYFKGDDPVAGHVDVLFCSMVLEHQQYPISFIRAMTKQLDENCLIVIEVPHIQKSIDENRFHDFYYDHCNYFSPFALRYCVQQAGLEPMKILETFDSNNLVIFCKKSSLKPQPPSSIQSNETLFEKFSNNYNSYLKEKKSQLDQAHKKGKITFFGASAKCQTVLNTFKLSFQRIPFVMDNNSELQGKYVVGTGNVVLTPDKAPPLTSSDTIFLTNSTYVNEITLQLQQLNVNANLVIF